MRLVSGFPITALALIEDPDGQDWTVTFDFCGPRWKTIMVEWLLQEVEASFAIDPMQAEVIFYERAPAMQCYLAFVGGNDLSDWEYCGER